MAAEQVVTELTIDGRGAEAGSALYIRAMQAAQSAVDRMIDKNRALEQSITNGNVVMLGSSNSIAATARAWERFKAAMDPAAKSTQEIERATLLADRAVKLLGVDSSEAARFLETLKFQHDAAAQAAKRQADEYVRLAAAGREAYAADQNQRLFSSALGVRDPADMSGAARTSASVFEAELSRFEEIAGLKAQQAGRTFGAELDQLLIAGAGKSARDAASIFSVELDRIDEIASLKARQAGLLFQSDLNTSLGIDRAGTSARSSASVFEQAAQESEMYEQKARDLRTALGDVSVMQDRLNAELAEYAVLAERGLISSDQLAKAQQMARVQASRGVSGGAARAAGFSAGQQLQDIAMMSLIGQSPTTLALQQGPQLATAIKQGGGLAALGTGLASLFSATTLVTVGITAATAATIQWFMKGKDGAKSFNEALKAHSDALKLLKEDYGQLGEAAKNAGSVAGIAFTDASARNAQALIEAQLRTKMSPFLDDVGGVGWLSGMFGNGGGVDGLRNLSGDQRLFAGPASALMEAARQGNSQAGLEKFRKDVEALFATLVGNSNAPTQLRATADAVELLGENAFTVSGKFAPFADQINRLKVEGADGLATYNEEVAKIGRDKGIQSIADDAIIAGKEVVALAQKAADLEKIVNRLGAGKRGPLIGSSAEDDRNDYLDAQRLGLRQLGIDRDLAFDRLYARSPADQAKIARKDAELQRKPGEEDPAVWSYRENTAAALAYAQALKQITDAQDGRVRSMDTALKSQQLDLALIGKTPSEVAAAQFAFQQYQQVREEAFRNGITGEEEFQKVFGREIDLIGEAARKMKEYADHAARARLRNDLQFDIDQIGRSPIDQQIAATQKQYGIPVDLDSADAAAIRYALNVKKVSDAWQDARDVGMDAIDALTDSASKGFKNISDVAEDIGKDIEKMILQYTVANPIKNLLFDAGLPTAADMGGLGGIFSALTGGKFNPGKIPGIGELGTVTNPMYVVSVGGAGGLPGEEGGLLGTVKRLFAPANSNDPSALPAGVGSPLSFVGNYKQGVDNRLTDILNEAAKRFSGYGVEAFSGFRPGDPRFHGQGLATDVRLTDLATGKALANYQDPSTFSTYEKFAQVARQVQMEKFPELADKFRWGGYFSGGRGKYGAMDEMHFDLGGGKVGMAGGSWENGLTAAQRSLFPGIESAGNKAISAITRMAGTAEVANKGLGILGQGMGQVGNALSQFPAAPSGGGGGGGLLSWLGNLFTPMTPLSSLSSQAASYVSAGMTTGLFHDGRYPGNPGSTRLADPSWFLNAPRFHNGRIPPLAPDEQAAIIRRDEPIFRNMDHARQVVGGGKTVVQLKHETIVHNNVGGAEVRQETSDDGNGGTRTEIFFDKQGASNINRRNSATDKALSGRGLRAMGPRR